MQKLKTALYEILYNHLLGHNSVYDMGSHPPQKKDDDSEEDFHTVDEDSPVPHIHTDSCTKFIQKIKDQKKKDDNDNNDDFRPYQPPCGTCSG